jgi:hypothetical protein
MEAVMMIAIAMATILVVMIDIIITILKTSTVLDVVPHLLVPSVQVLAIYKLLML